MKTITIILISLLSVSCLTVKRIERNCSEFAKICEVPVKKEVRIIRDVQTEVIYRDTVIYKYLPGKVVERKIPVYINKGIVESDLSVLNTQLARSTARVFNSRLEHELIQTDTTLPFKLEDALRDKKTLEKQNKVLKEKYVVTVMENSNFAKVAIKVFWGLVVIVVIGIGYLIVKNKAKILGLIKRIS